MNNKEITVKLITSIQKDLFTLKKSVLTMDFKIASNRKKVLDAITAIKNKYLELEGIVTNTVMPVFIVPLIKLSINKTIVPVQMEAWLSKLHKNIDALLNKIDIEIIKHQYILLDIVIKVLNGDAYFTGCSHEV